MPKASKTTTTTTNYNSYGRPTSVTRNYHYTCQDGSTMSFSHTTSVNSSRSYGNRNYGYNSRRSGY